MYLQMKVRHYDCADCGTAVQEYLPKRGSVPEVREGMGEGPEPTEPATQIPATHGGAAGG